MLRHRSEAIGLALDAEGWGSVDSLIAGAARQGWQLSRKLIEQATGTNYKKHLELLINSRRIRAKGIYSAKVLK